MTDRQNWNMSSLRQRSYRVPTVRVHKPIGKTRDQLCDEAGLSATHVFRSEDMTCAHCGHMLCSCATKLEKQPWKTCLRCGASSRNCAFVLGLCKHCDLALEAQCLPKTTGDAEWARKMRDAQKTVRVVGGHSLGQTFLPWNSDEELQPCWVPSDRNWVGCTFEVVE